jgi:TolA-binding protein
MNWMFRTAVAAGLIAALAAPAAAQSPVSQADVQRLQDNVYLAERDVNALQSRDAARATQLQTELDELGDEVIYLRVKLRKERTLARSEFTDVESRIESVRTRARDGGNASTLPPRPPAPPAPLPAPVPDRPASTRTNREIPAGTELDVRLSNVLNSGTANVEGRGPLRGDDAGGPGDRRAHARAGRRGDAWHRERRRACHTHQPDREDDGQLRPAHLRGTHLSDARHFERGTRG